jgi:hypothetical protein
VSLLRSDLDALSAVCLYEATFRYPLDAMHSTSALASLQSARSSLFSLPRSPVEPVAVVFSAGSVLGGILAPAPLRAADVSIQAIPVVASPGCPFRVSLETASSDDGDCGSSLRELSTSIASLVGHVDAVALLSAAPARDGRADADPFSELPARQPLVFAVEAVLASHHDGRCGVDISFHVPPSAPMGSVVVLEEIRVAGEVVCESSAIAEVVVGLKAPLQLQNVPLPAFVNACVAPDGTFFLPTRTAITPFAADGSPLAPLPVGAFGLSDDTRVCAWGGAVTAEDGAHTLLLADCGKTSCSEIVAVDATSRALRWAASPQEWSGFVALAALPRHGIVVAGGARRRISGGDRGLCAYRLADGVCTARLDAPVALYAAADESSSSACSSSRRHPSSPAAPAAAAVIYFSDSTVSKGVQAAIWVPQAYPAHRDSEAEDTTGESSSGPQQHGCGALIADGTVEAAGGGRSYRPLAIVPAALQRRRTSRPGAVEVGGGGCAATYLVVGDCYKETLLVLSLPDRRLVHTHTLTGMGHIKALAADATGTALVVCDGSPHFGCVTGTVHVLPWPLPGMPVT